MPGDGKLAMAGAEETIGHGVCQVNTMESFNEFPNTHKLSPLHPIPPPPPT